MANHRLIFILLFSLANILLLEGSIKAEKLVSNQEVESHEIEKRWHARWIWSKEANNAEAILARKSFSLSTQPAEATIKITASDSYQLYVNGNYVQGGPARSAAHHQSYDCIDISSHLKRGDNLIAVRAVFEAGAKSYFFDARAGLLVQLNMDGQEIISDNTWQLIEDKSWGKDSPAISRFQRDVNDRVDMCNYEHSWYTVAYNDSNWEKANELIRSAGWPSHQKGAPSSTFINPWTSLVPRDIPLLKDSLLLAGNLIQTVAYTEQVINMAASKISLNGAIDKEIKKNFKRSLKTGEAFPIDFKKDETGRLLIFDFGELLNGFPHFDIVGQEGTEVNVLCAPYVLDKQFCASIVDAKFEDQIILSGKSDKWEATYFKPCRYMAVWFENKGQTIQINKIGLRQISYPFELNGNMSSSDAPWVNDYFEASAKTINVCTTDAMTDNYRERRQYAQTGYYGALGNYYTFGDLALQGRYLTQVAQEQMADGIMPAHAPMGTEDYMVILDSNCFWLKSLRNYFLYSGDTETITQLIPTAERLLNLLDGFTNEYGLIDNPPYAYWLDHAVNDRSGASFTLNAHYLEALENYSELLSWLDKDEPASYYERALKLRNSLNQYFWNDEKGLFVDALIDGNQSKMISEHANAMALALKIATQKQGAIIAKNILEEDNNDFVKRASGMTMVTPAMSYYLHKGLCEYGYVKESFKLFNNRFGHMLDENTNQTLWEEWWLDGTGRSGKFQEGKTRSDAQTESAFPPALFAEYLFGIKPVEPGLKKWELQYFESGVKTLEASIPAGVESIFISWETATKKVLRLVVPDGISIDLNLESLKAEGNIIVNKEKLKGSPSNLSLTEGVHTITF